MKYIMSIMGSLLLCSCSNEFINHSLQAEKAGACNNEAVPVKMTSNINGERYQFEYCLYENFEDKNYTIDRKGDSLLVKFPKPSGKPVLYKLILDIDAKPPYRYITLGEGGQTIPIVPVERL